MKVLSLNISTKRGVRKTPVESCGVVENSGIEGDAHSGPWHRQVSLLGVESIEKARSWGLNVNPGDFAENITTESIDLTSLPIGSRIEAGDVLLEVTQIGKTCHDKCDIYKQVGKCVMPKEGIFTKVLKGGALKKGGEIHIKK
ncbi:MAG: molybdenum cofactor sulfurase [Candidatus Altiarchaeales archaeon WOR_SM1_86-2]|nr:MAG: molybdenum cofactor sulfurase [Candidatus Altiarchaeales archaeon WOR_SM1_86-2]ODS38218.1 MAG: molybdenum cofactor sulfurase [Candidatus Altiarchaeales archaeon WOR_SM1_79]